MFNLLYVRIKLFVLLFSLVFNPAAIAGPILDEVVETMMEANAIESSFIGITFGVDDNVSINFNSNVNTGTRTFSYSTLPNQIYRGLNLSIISEGVYDDVLGVYMWTSEGVFGNQIWTSQGTVEWVGDPEGTAQVTFTIPSGNGPITVNVKAKVNYIFNSNSVTSEGTYTYSLLDGTPLASFPGKDVFFASTKTWEHSVTVPKTKATPDGVNNFATGLLASRGEDGDDLNGVFNVRILSVPEPGTAILLAVGLLGVSLTRKRKISSLSYRDISMRDILRSNSSISQTLLQV